jgi:hypothetical protein
MDCSRLLSTTWHLVKNIRVWACSLAAHRQKLSQQSKTENEGTSEFGKVATSESKGEIASKKKK